jgi:acyl carrier protein
MTTQAILAEVNKVFAHVFDDSGIVIKASTSAKDIPEWDSLNHATLISAVEEHFKIKFTLKEIMRFKDVGDMCVAIGAKLNAQP